MVKTLLRSLLLMCVSLFTLHAIAQETTSEIQGQVTNGKIGMYGADIVAVHEPTGTKYHTLTRKDGRFNLPNVKVGGPYTITVSYVGFGSEKQDNVYLVLGEDFKADFSLKQQTDVLSEVVITTVKQDRLFNNAHTGSQEIITRDQIEKLPTINRSIQDFTKLEPTAASSGLSFSGSSQYYNNVTVDGADFNNSFGLANTLGGQANAQPIALDAIDQIQVNVSPYDVRQGGFTGAGINSVTKSGTNTFRGTAYTYLKGPGTQGYNVENTLVAKTPFTFNITGASLGGPIIKNKLFFFINAEQDLQSAPATSIVPSNSTNAPSANAVSATNSDTLTLLSQFLQSKYGYNPGSFQGYSFQTNSYKVNARIDWNINSANTFTFKYNYLKSYADQFASTSRPGSGQVTGGQPTSNGNPMPFYGSGYRINNDLNVFIAELNTRINRNVSNKFQIGYTQEKDFRSPQSVSDSFPLMDIMNSSTGNTYTTFGYEPYTYNNKLFMDSYQMSDILTYYKGAHEITIGTQDSYKKYQNAFAPGYNGVYQFSSLDAFLNGSPAKNYYLQYSALPGGAFPWAYAAATNVGLFAQDKWRATNNFTLTYGLRFDYTVYKQDFLDNPYFDNLKFKDGVQYDVGKAPNSFLIVSPRVGFNWDIKNDKTLQLRGGLGMFEGAPPFVWIENQAANNGVQWGSNTYTNVAVNPNLLYRSQQMTALGINTSTLPTSYGVDITSKNFKYPTKFRTSLGLDKRFENNWVITGEFTYSKDINAAYFSNVNLNESNEFAISNGPDDRMRYNTTPTATSGTNSSNKYYNGTSLTNPSITSAILMSNTNLGYSYTATAKVQKTFRRLYVSAAYTFSQAKNTAENGSTASSLWGARAVSNTDPNAPNLAYASWYQPHRVIAVASYKIEYAKYFATSFGAIFEAAPAGVTSYVYNGDLNGDGNTGNDLIYIPRSASEINLIDAGSYNATTHSGITTGTAADPRTSSMIWNQLNNFINQDHYLRFHRGAYAQANAVVEPFFKKLDLNITQDISVKTGKERHTIRLSLDLINAGNFVNRNWGLVKAPSSTNFLKFEGMAADGKTPLFSFPYADATNQIPLVNSFSNNTGITSRWQMQFGIRYLFN